MDFLLTLFNEYARGRPVDLIRAGRITSSYFAASCYRMSRSNLCKECDISFTLLTLGTCFLETFKLIVVEVTGLIIYKDSLIQLFPYPKVNAIQKFRNSERTSWWQITITALRTRTIQML